MNQLFDTTQISDLLAKVKHFQSMKMNERVDIITSGRVKHYRKNAVIFTQGENCAGMFVLLSGQVQLQKIGPEGKKQILEIIYPVIMFNEVPVLDGGPNVATAIATKKCICWNISFENFQTLLYISENRHWSAKSACFTQ